MNVTADHGEQLHEHGYISHSAQVYEQSIHVPLVVRLPAGKGPRGASTAWSNLKSLGYVDACR